MFDVGAEEGEVDRGSGPVWEADDTTIGIAV
jgi:hypothetical protein